MHYFVRMGQLYDELINESLDVIDGVRRRDSVGREHAMDRQRNEYRSLFLSHHFKED